VIRTRGLGVLAFDLRTSAEPLKWCSAAGGFGTRGTMTQFERRALRARQQRLDRAIEVLKHHPQFPATQVHILESTKVAMAALTETEKQMGTAARLEAVLRLLDMRARDYVELVTSMESQEAFMIVLGELGRQAWKEYTGFHIEMLQPAAGDTQYQTIQCRLSDWIGEGYKRLVPISGAASHIGGHDAGSPQRGVTSSEPADHHPRLDVRDGAQPTTVDIAVITIREDEYEAVLNRLTEPELMKCTHRSYVIGTVSSRTGRPYQVALLRSVEQGPNAGQDAARDIIEDLDPQWLGLVGIAGALPDKDFCLGDVVVATRLHDFSVSAFIEDTEPEFANQGGPMKKEIQDLIALLPALRKELGDWNLETNIGLPVPKIDLRSDRFYGPEQWKRRVKDALRARFGPKAVRQRPIVTARPVASSGSLIKDTEIVEGWRKTARDVAAVEMELAGVYAAARRMVKEYPVLAVRGISDIVGFKRDVAWTTYACNTAASLFVALLHSLPSGTLNPSRQTQLVSGTNNNPTEAPSVPPADRPRVAFREWGRIPDDHSVPIRAGQAGFSLANDGGAAYEVTVEGFVIRASVTARGETISRIAGHGDAFALVWLEGFSPLAIATAKWDLLGAMRDAAGQSTGLYGGPDYSIDVSVTYRNADGSWWFRSMSRLTYIRSQDRLALGPTTHNLHGHTKEAIIAPQHEPNAPTPPTAILEFVQWHAGSGLGQPRLGNGLVPSFVAIKNTQTAVPITAEHVRAHLRYRNAAGTIDLTLASAPWFISRNPPNDPNAYWTGSVDLEASETQSFALFVSDDKGMLWAYKDPTTPIGHLAFGRWDVSITVTAENADGFEGTISFTHSRHDGLKPDAPAFVLIRRIPCQKTQGLQVPHS